MIKSKFVDLLIKSQNQMNGGIAIINNFVGHFVPSSNQMLHLHSSLNFIGDNFGLWKIL